LASREARRPAATPSDPPLPAPMTRSMFLSLLPSLPALNACAAMAMPAQAIAVRSVHSGPAPG